MAKTIHDFEMKTIDGKAQKLGDYRGKVLLVVNVASKCGLTPHYKGLQALYEEKKGAGFTVLGFPCNQFGGQEPGSEADVKTFCSTTYGVNFPMFSKIDVNGAGRAPLRDFSQEVARMAARYVRSDGQDTAAANCLISWLASWARGYALNALVAHDTVPGRTNLWGEYLEKRGDRTAEMMEAARNGGANSGGIGTPEDMRSQLRAMQEAGVDQVIFLQQAGRNEHRHICESLELFAREVMPDFQGEVAAREARKRQELAPYVAAALSRKKWMKPLADHEIPVVKASVTRALVNRGATAS
jgi:glutathione peroxidase-family protein